MFRCSVMKNANTSSQHVAPFSCLIATLCPITPQAGPSDPRRLTPPPLPSPLQTWSTLAEYRTRSCVRYWRSVPRYSYETLSTTIRICSRTRTACGRCSSRKSSRQSGGRRWRPGERCTRYVGERGEGGGEFVDGREGEKENKGTWEERDMRRARDSGPLSSLAQEWRFCLFCFYLCSVRARLTFPLFISV